MARGPRGVVSGRIRSLLLDGEGLSKSAAGDVRAHAHLIAARRLRLPVVVSALTLAEVLRGHPRDAGVHLLLKGCVIEPVTREIGRAAGELLGRTRRWDTVDAVIAATAATLPAPVQILTSDADDLRALTADIPGVRVDRV